MDSKVLYLIIILSIKFAVYYCEDYDNSPLKPCQPWSCEQDSVCHAVLDRAMCSCSAGFLGSPPSCHAECNKNADCPINKACIDHKCEDPCETHVCGEDAVCQVFEHTPVCSCLVNRKGDPSVKCDLILCGINAIRRKGTDSKINCTCEDGFVGNPYAGCNRPCRNEDECLKDRTCYRNECVDSCSGACGKNSNCYISNHYPVCTCRPGYTGDPFIKCSPIFAPHNSIKKQHYTEAKEIQFNCKEYLKSPNSSQVASINMTENRITTYTAFVNRKMNKTDNGTILCCLVYVDRGTDKIKNLTHSVEKLTLFIYVNKIDIIKSYHTTIYAISASVGIIILTLSIIIPVTKCRRKKINQELPQLKINKNDVFYLNLLFKRECEREIEEAEHHYEEIEYVEVGSLSKCD